MFYSIVDAVGTGSAVNVSVPPYIDKSHIFVYVDFLPFTTFEWINAQTISVIAQLNRPIRVVRRTSPAERLTIYQDGKALPGDTLEVDSLQAFYMAQEAIDLALLAGGTVGTPPPGIELTQQGLKDLLAGQITPSELELQLREEIGLITGAQEVVGSVAWKVYQESLARAAALTSEADARVAALLKEAQDRDEAISVEAEARQTAIDSMAQQITTLTATLNGNIAAVQSEQLTRINEDGVLAQRLDTVVAQADTDRADLNASITAASTASTERDNALASSVETMAAGLEAADQTLDARVTEEAQASVERDSALAGRISVFEAGGISDVEAVKARVTSAEQAIVDEEGARAAAVSSLDAAYKAADDTLQTRIINAETAIAEGDSALAERAAALEAKVDLPAGTTVSGFVAEQTEALASADQAQANQITTLQARVMSRPNECPNGGFEQGLEGWTGDPGWSATDSIWGRAVLNTSARTSAVSLQSAEFPVQGGAEYTVHGDSIVFADGPFVEYFDLIFTDASGNWTLDGPQNPITSVHDFSISDSNRERSAVSATAPAASVKAFVRWVVDPTPGTTITVRGVRQVKVERGGLPYTAYSSEGSGVQVANRVATVEQSATTTANRVGTVEANLTLKVQARADGKKAIAGIGLNATASDSAPTQSELVFMADKMTFVPGLADLDAVPQPLFVAGVVDGQNTFVVPPQRMGDKMVEARMYVEGSIEARHVKAKGLTVDQIDTKGLDIRDEVGNLLFGAGKNLDTMRKTRNFVRGFATWAHGGPNWVAASEPRATDGRLLVIPAGSNYTPSQSPVFGIPRNGDPYVVSFMAWCGWGATRNLLCDLSPDTLPDVCNLPLTGTPTLYRFNINVGHPDADNCTMRFFAPAGTTDIYICNPQIEYGSEYTPWKPANEDVLSSSNRVTAGNVTTFIDNAAINAAQIGSLGVNTLSTTMSGGVISGGRITMEANKLQVFDSSNALRVKLGYLL